MNITLPDIIFALFFVAAGFQDRAIGGEVRRHPQ